MKSPSAIMSTLTLDFVQSEVLRISELVNKSNLTITDYQRHSTHTWSAAGKATGKTFNEIKKLIGLPCSCKTRKAPEDRAHKPPKFTGKPCLKCDRYQVRPGFRRCDSCIASD